MASTYVNNLRLEEIGTGEQSGTWGDTTNTNLEIIGQAVAWGTRAIADASTDNITIADGALDADRCLGLKLTGGGQACTVSLLPNTSSKTWFMYNATAAALTFTCGSGANVIIPAGQTKVIATDGLGSGGVVHDLLTAVNLAGTTVVDDLTVSDDLTVTDDMTVGGTLGVTGVLTATSLDISGDIDVDGTTNLDAVDIDGAVNMATTALVTGVLTTTAATVFNGGFASNAGSTITENSGAALEIISTDTGAGGGPRIDWYRNPGQAGTDSDNLAQLNFFGLNDASEKTQYLYLFAEMADVADGSEDVRFGFGGLVGGVDTSLMTFSYGTQATGANPVMVFNEDSKDINFRVESNGNANMLFVDGGNDVVNIGGTTAITTAALTVGKTAVGSNTALRIDYNDDNSAPSSVLELSKEGTIFGRFGGASTTVSGAAATAVVVQSQANIYFDATGSFIFNEVGDDVDFRVESDAKPYCLFVNSTQNNVSIGYSAESLSQTPGLVILSKDTSGGVYLIKEDGSQPSSGEGLGSFGWRGTDDTNSMNAADARITAFAVENHSGSDAATDMRFYTKTTSQGPGNGPTEVLRLTQTGDVIAQTGDIYFATAGKGIVLGATTNVAANTLDDYEEGSFTVGYTGATIDGGGTTAQYTKVGSMVFWSFYSAASNINSASGNAAITGLPFTVRNNDAAYSPVNIAHNTYFGASTTIGTMGYHSKNSTSMVFNTPGVTATATYVNGDSKYLMISGTYFTDL